MSDIALLAATEWAKQHACTHRDPIAFGAKVALAFQACREVGRPGKDLQSMAALLASLSTLVEVPQSLALPTSHLQGSEEQGLSQTALADSV